MTLSTRSTSVRINLVTKVTVMRTIMKMTMVTVTRGNRKNFLERMKKVWTKTLEKIIDKRVGEKPMRAD